VDSPEMLEMLYDDEHYLSEENINRNIKLDTYNIQNLDVSQITIKSKIISLMQKLQSKNFSHCEVDMTDGEFSDLPSLIYTSEDVFDYEKYKENNIEKMNDIYCSNRINNTSCGNIDYICSSIYNNDISDNLKNLVEDSGLTLKDNLIDGNDINLNGNQLIQEKCKDCSCFNLTNNEEEDNKPINKLLPWEVYNYLTYDLDEKKKLEFIENDCMNYYLINLDSNSSLFDNYDWDSDYDYTKNLKESIEFENELQRNNKTSLISLDNFKDNSVIFNKLVNGDFFSCK